MRPLPRSFYLRPTQLVAPELLGCVLAHGERRGTIVEVEAYGGPGDVASHAHKHPGGRAKLMFGTVGVAYVYMSYGIHRCMNAVAHAPGHAGAVLIRSVEIDGEPRAGSGPGLVCRTLDIDISHYGTDLVDGPVRVLRGAAPDAVRTGTRIGLRFDDDRAWRFWTPSPAVSRNRRG